MSDVNKQVRVCVLMLLWSVWHVRNELVHAKLAPPIDVPTRFLASYLDSLACLKLDLNADFVNGKIAG